MSFREMFDKFDDVCRPIGSVTFNWEAKGVGFGQMEFHVGEDGYVHCYNEIMGREFLKKMLCQMIDNAVMEEPHRDEGDGKPSGYLDNVIEE